MFKLVVLFAVLAVAVASPGVYPLAYTHSAVIPTAVSHQSRTDYVSKPVIAAYSAPLAYSAPVAYSAPAYAYSAPAYSAPAYSAHAYAYPAAISHQSRIDYVNKPVIAAYSAPLGYGYGGKLAYGYY